jgi:hypothetical protein
MELSEGIAAPAKISYAGTENLELAAGKHLQLRTGSPIETLLDGVVPAHKKWIVNVVVSIDEVDA